MRGTDIILGGNPEFESKREMRKLGYTDEQISFATSFLKSDDPELNGAREKFNVLMETFKAERQAEHEEVVALGGLFILGSERHESRRIDNQLRGRSGRQGDPGHTQFFISLEDDLMRLFGGERIQAIISRVGVEEDEPIETRVLSRSIENAQKKVEGKNFGIRKYVLQYDNVMNKQREIIYSERRRVLFGEDLREHIMNMKNTMVETIIEPVTMAGKFPEEWDFAGMNRDIHKLIPLYNGKSSYTPDELRTMTAESLTEDVELRLDRIYEIKEQEIGPERMREIERMVLLRVVDNLWMDHIDAMDQLKSGIGLRAIGQQDPAAEYGKEGFEMWEQLMGAIQEDTVRYCYGVTINTGTQRKAIVTGGTASKSEYRDDDTLQSERGRQSGQAAGIPKQGAKVPPRQTKPETVRRDRPKVGRNDPCPCGSGKKYKN